MTDKPSHERKGNPLYAQLASEFRRLITRNVWPVGTRVAKLEALAEQYGVARITVRQAMDLLEEEGLIRRTRGVGTEVIKTPPAARWVRMRTDWDEFVWPVGTAFTRILSSEPADAPPEVAPHEGRLRGPYRRLEVITYRAAGGPPISVRTTYLREAVHQLVEARIERSLYLALLAEHAWRITVFDEITTASARVARALEIPVGSPVVEARHVALDRDGVVAYVDHPIVRGEFVKFEITLTRDPDNG